VHSTRCFALALARRTLDKLPTRILSLWTGLQLQVDFELICMARCKIYLASPEVIRAPKWGVRSHQPLQLVGHEGLDKVRL
jgi:hypothetical protein